MKRIVSIALAVMLVLSLCSASFAEPVRFTSSDSKGDVYDESIFEGKKLVFVNLWEPWCGPCRGELEDLGRLYENYKDKGLLILGVYRYTDVDEYTLGKTADELFEEAGCAYPNICSEDAFAAFDVTGGRPTSFFLDENGEHISLSAYKDGWHKADMDSFLNYINSFVEDFESGKYDEHRDYPEAFAEIEETYKLYSDEAAKNAYLENYEDLLTIAYTDTVIGSSMSYSEWENIILTLAPELTD